MHKGDCVWPVEGSNVAVFVTDVLLGDDNTVCVTCDPQRYCNQLEKHCRCKSSTSTLRLEKSTVQRIVQNVDTACGPRGADGPTWVEDPGVGLFAVEGDGSASKIFQPARVYHNNRGLSQIRLVYNHDRCLSVRLHGLESGRPAVLGQAVIHSALCQESVEVQFREVPQGRRVCRNFSTGRQGEHVPTT